MDNKKYSALVKFKAFIKKYKSHMETHDCIGEIFKDSDMNCQIPTTEFFKFEEPEVIGCTALHLALRDNYTDSFEQLLNRGVDFTIKNDRGMTVLHEAIESSHNKSKECWKLKGRLTHPRANLVLSAHVQSNNLANPHDNHGMTHFHIACMLNHTRAVQFFLNGGVCPNKAVPENSARLPGYTPLHIAARYCCFETAQVLLQHGADKHSRDAKNMTPLHLLLQRRMEIMDHMLMHKRAPYDFFKEELDLNEKIVKLFMNKEDCNATDPMGFTDFQAACTLQDIGLVEELFEQGVDLDHTVSADSPVWPGYSALHFSMHGNFETARLLLSRGANVLAKDASGVTPLDLCLNRYNAENIQVVLTKVLSQMNLDDIGFSDRTTKLTDLVYAMRSSLAFISFLTEPVRDVNAFIPHDSPLWPGYTPMHLAAVFPERLHGIEDLYKTSDYDKEDCPRNYYNCDATEEALYEQRIFILLRVGADVTIQDARGSTPVHLAFPLKSDNTFDWLLSNQRKVLNPVDERGLSHLHIGCASRHRPFVERMLPTFIDSINDQTTSSFEYRFVNQEEKEIRRLFVSAGSTLLHIAVAACDFDTISTLLRHNASVYVQDTLGMTPIHQSLRVMRSSRFMMDLRESWRFEMLLSVKNVTDCVTDFGLSHLHVASYWNHAPAIEKLLASGANTETTIKYRPSEELSFLAPYNSYTPLHVAMHNRDESTIDALAKGGADFLAEESGGHAVFLKMLMDEHSRTSLRCAFVRTVKNDPTLQQRILEKFGLTMLHVACTVHDADLVAKLLDDGADPNAVTNENCQAWCGWSPLHVMVVVSSEYKVRFQIIELLLSHGADVLLTNKAGDTPIHCLFRVTYVEGCDYLDTLLKYQKDYNVNPTNVEGVSHFHAACMSGDTSIVEEFLKRGVHVDLPIDYFTKSHKDYTFGSTPLHVAVYQNQGYVIDLLLKYGANINARDCLDNTPFHVAARHSLNFENLFDRLVSAGADVHARTLLGATALEKLTRIPSNWKEIELLKKHGYRINSFNPLTHEGLIGLSLKNDTDDLALNSFYEDVIDSADASDVDNMGRTPLHNIVSCDGFKTSAEAVAQFLKIGYDIDHQDNQGRTALHCAASFANAPGFVGLLEYGADINITDCNKQSAFTYFLEKKSERKNWYKPDIQNIITSFVKHVYKLNLIKFSVNELNTNAYAKMIKKVDLEEQFSLDCQNELKEMQKKTIDSLSITFFDFLTSETRVIAAYPTMPISKRQALNAIFEAEQNILRQDFPQLSCLLYLQYRKALARIDLIESAKCSLNTLLRINMPYLCSNIIFGFVTNEDLKNVISSSGYFQPRKL